MAPHHHRQMGVLVPDGLMPVGPTPICNRRQRAGVTALGRYLPHHILACPRGPPPFSSMSSTRSPYHADNVQNLSHFQD